MNSNPEILLTGASGFVGNALLGVLGPKHLSILGRKSVQGDFKAFFHADIAGNTDYSAALKGIDVIIHSAARVHVMDEKSSDPLAEFREVNTAGTLNLAQQAADSGVKRFIFISSIKVNGEKTFPGKPFQYDDKPMPEDAYGISKAEAETGLRQIALKTGMEVVIIRPPLVYGPGVKANFAAMMSLAKKNLPLPLGAINNKRSLVAIDNLTSLVVTCVTHPKAANQTFLVSDDNDLSTTELVETMFGAIGKKAIFIPVPVKVLHFAARLLGKGSVIDRLYGNLEVNIEFTKNALGWSPVVSVHEAIKKCFAKE
ncbi:SDR family oxidoreductase [Rheinheimera sediminis]|uniref:UDP-glucose 4-epimerase family protein n=1 Tax=Rheinheimera sp. YQF-1 TaxID=2499626 RepID=UPI000FD75C59|nr:SDR family oxidoreductase [Rheinheimera sp. YQF-1]RVT46908.1 SDR family oxidoreductase [Rheinheimera sp. YQF-1]